MKSTVVAWTHTWASTPQSKTVSTLLLLKIFQRKLIDLWRSARLTCAILNWIRSLFNSGYYRFHKVVYCVKMCHKIVAKIWKPLDILLRECRGFVEWPSWSRSCWLLLRRPPGIIFVHQLYIVSFFSLAKIHCCRLKKFGGKRGTLFSRKNLVSRTPYYRARICWWRHDTFNPRASTVEPSPLGKKA